MHNIDTDGKMHKKKMSIGKTIFKIRAEQKMTQEQFAQIFHVTRQTISNWEKEKSYPDLQTLVKISDTYGISLDIMLKEDSKLIEKYENDRKLIKKVVISIILITVLAVFAILSVPLWFGR